MPIGRVTQTTQMQAIVGQDCILRDGVCVPQGDRRQLTFFLYDEDGDEFDTSLITAARFIVSEGQEFGGNINAGGEIYFERTLGNGIFLRGDGYSLGVTLTAPQTSAVTNYRNYMQLQIEVGASRYTVAAGLYISEFTQ